MEKQAKKVYDALYYQTLSIENKKIRLKRAKSWRLEHPAETKEHQNVYYMRHSEQRRNYNKEYKKALPVLVYRWISPKGYTAYVGRGTRYRINSHKRNSAWYEPDMFVRTLKARNEWHAMKLEGLWGELFQPRYNKDGYRR